jgi:RNA polymerase sigma-70 factor (ECF subfamily)
VCADIDDGFVVWYQASHRRLVGSMLALSGDAGLAAEVTDEAFTRAFVHWDRVAAMASPDGWLYRVAVNLLRRRQRRVALERRLLSRLWRPDTTPTRPEPVFDIVRRLPSRQRAVIVLRYVADLPDEQVAAILGVSRSTVSTSLSVARRRLAAELGDPPAVKEAPHG